MGEVEWANLKAHELRRLAEQDAVVLLPVAALEQHGPHLPVQVDTRLAGEISKRTAKRAGSVYIHLSQIMVPDKHSMAMKEQVVLS